jgi:hypothetical protein
MSRPNKNGNHIFLPITRSNLTSTAPVSRADATITGIASQVCFNCHGPNDTVILDLVRQQKNLYKEAREAFEYVTSLRGYYFNDGVFQQRDGTNYRVGLASLTNGSAIVTGVVSTIANSLVTGGVVTSVTTSFTAAGVAVGADQLLVDGTATPIIIQSVDSPSQITLAAPYGGPTAANARFSILKNESVLFTQGSPTVVGTNTNWTTTGVVSGSSGDYIRNDNDGTWYRIAAVNNDTTLTMSAAYAGTNGTGPYTIINGSANAFWLTPTGGTPDTDISGKTTGKNNMGALFNLYLFEADPAGYVHNRYYMKRLLYDAIDWLDDNQMNFSTGTTIDAICTAAVPAPPVWCTGAMEYVLPNGVIPGGISAERP